MGQHVLDAVLNLLRGRDTGRVDVVYTRANLVRVSVRLECAEEFHIALGCLDGDDIGIETFDGGEDVIEVRVAEMRVCLGGVLDTCRRETEGVNCPCEIVIPVFAAERETFTDSRLINLNGVDASGFEVNDFVTEGKGKLLRLDLAGHVDTGEGPVKDGDRPSEHTLHGLLSDALRVATPLDSDGGRTADI